jgi:hypothetical protein
MSLWTGARNRWLHPTFSEALKLRKKESDERVERSLYQKAIGYSYDAVKIFLPYAFNNLNH